MTNDGSWQEGEKKRYLTPYQAGKQKKQNPPTFEFYNSILSLHWSTKAALKQAYLFFQG